MIRFIKSMALPTWCYATALGLLSLASLASQGEVTRAAQAAATPTADLCRDRYEDDGVPSQAKPLVIGETQNHLFCPAGDADWLTFFANRGKGYRIETSFAGAGVDSYLNLFAPDGRTLITANDDAPGARGASQITFYPPADGWYYIQAKNQGDIGYAGLGYSIGLRQLDAPTSTATATATKPPATPAPTQKPASAGDLLHPQPSSEGGLPVFAAGPPDATAQDAFEPNDAREQAKPVNVGALYKYLNFIHQVQASTDVDFYTFRAKPGLCYLVKTQDLSPGLDTTILLWQAVNGREKWKLVAQNDDAHLGTADLGSSVRWCATADRDVVAEVRNYGGRVATDPLGKTYSLAVMVDPPTPAPTKVPAGSPPEHAPPQRHQSAQGTAAQGVPAQSRLPQAPAVPSPTATAPPTSTPPAPSASPTLTALPASPTATPPQVSVDVVAYIADQSATGPNPGDGIVGLPVLLVDVRTNAVIERIATDENGHARITWEWQGPVRVALPAFRWGKTLQLGDFTAGSGNGKSLLLQARMSGYALPGIYP